MSKKKEKKVTTSIMLRDFPIELADQLKIQFRCATSSKAILTACQQFIPMNEAYQNKRESFDKLRFDNIKVLKAIEKKISAEAEIAGFLDFLD